MKHVTMLDTHNAPQVHFLINPRLHHIKSEFSSLIRHPALWLDTIETKQNKMVGWNLAARTAESSSAQSNQKVIKAGN